MLKEQLIQRVSELETELQTKQSEIRKMLEIANNLLYWNTKSYSLAITIQKISNTQELFFELWKLVEFRDNILEQKNYERDKENKEHYIESLEQKLQDYKIN